MLKASDCQTPSANNRSTDIHSPTSDEKQAHYPHNAQAQGVTKPVTSIPGPKGHWLTGSLNDIKTMPFHLFTHKVAKEFGSMARIRLLHKNMIVVSNAKTVQQLLKARPKRFRRSRKLEKIFKEMGIHGVFSSEGQTWQNQRQLMNPAFKPSQVKYYLPMIQKCTEQLCNALAQSPSANDIQHNLMLYTVNITSSLAFGVELEELQAEDPEFQTYLNKIFPMISHRMHSPIPYWRLLKKQRDKELANALKHVRTRISSLIKNAQLKLSENGNKSAENLLQAMMLAKNEEGTVLSEEELIANVLTLLLAGEDTTANTLAWTLHYLADNPQAQELIFAEIHKNYPTDGVFTLESLESFPLVFAAAQEAMRLKPVAPHLILEPNSDEIVEGYYIPKGTLLVTLLANYGFNEELFTNSEEYDLERWLNLSAEQKKQYANDLMPFGFGARLCPGRQLSFIEMKIALIELIKHYRFSRNNSAGEVTEELQFTVVPVNLRLDFTAR